MHDAGIDCGGHSSYTLGRDKAQMKTQPPQTETQFVGSQNPFLREDGPSLQLIHPWRTVPGSRESFEGFFWGLWCSGAVVGFITKQRYER